MGSLENNFYFALFVFICGFLATITTVVVLIRFHLYWSRQPASGSAAGGVDDGE